MSWKTNRRTRQPYKTVPGRSISDLEENPQYSTTVAVGLVSDVGDEYEFTDDSVTVQQIMDDLNISPDEDFGAVFVKKSALSRGSIEADDALFITGTVPELYKQVYQVNERRTTEQKSGFNITGEKDTRYFPKPKKESGSGWTPFGTNDERYL